MKDKNEMITLDEENINEVSDEIIGPIDDNSEEITETDESTVVDASAVTAVLAAGAMLGLMGGYVAKHAVVPAAKKTGSKIKSWSKSKKKNKKDEPVMVDAEVYDESEEEEDDQNN